MGYLDVLYGIDNPAFLDMKRDRAYLVKVILPWMLKYLMTFRKIEALNEPVIDYLKNYTAEPEPAGHHRAALLPGYTHILCVELFQAVP